ncbi:MAG: AI-2E family transporter, partial [Bdellovibrionota bacterium]
FASVVFIPVVLAAFSAMLLWPMIAWTPARGPARIFVSFGITICFLAFIGLAGWIVVSSALDIASSLPEYSQKISGLVRRAREFTAAFEMKSASIFNAGVNTAVPAQRVELVERVPTWGSFALSSAGSLTEFFTIGLFVPLLMLYLFFDKENMVESIDSVLGKYAYLPKIHAELPRMVRAFVFGNFVVGIFLTACQGTLLYFLGYSNWISLAVVSGMLNLLPIVGAPLAMLFPLCQAIIQFHSAGPALTMMFGFVAFHFAGNNILLPQVVGARINVNSASLIIGLLFWSWLWGAGGFLLAIPMTSLIKIFLESHPETLPLANLMAARPQRIIVSNKQLNEIS